MAEEHKHDPRKLWQYLKSTGYSHKTKEPSAIVLDIHGETCHNKAKVANYLNSFFTTVAATLASELPSPTNKYTTNTPTFQNYKDNGIHPSKLKLTTISPDFTLRELKKLKTNKKKNRSRQVTCQVLEGWGRYYSRIRGMGQIL